MRGVVFVLLVGCTAAPPEIFAGAGTSVDAGTFDAGDLPPIADAGPRPDAGSPDAGSPDAGSPDAGSPDAGVRPRLSFTIVEIPDVNWPGDIAINSRGDVVGSYYAASLGSGVTRSFLFDSSTATTGSIGFGTAKGQFATGINDRGQIAFSTGNGNGIQQGYLLQDGAATPIGALLASSSPGSSAAVVINARGWIAGWSAAPDGQRHAILWNGTIHDLGTSGSWSTANGINSAGAVAGAIQVTGSNSIHAAVFIDGAIRDLGTLGGTLSFASAISDSGRVVGAATTAGSDYAHGFVYDLPAGPMIDVEPRASCRLRAVNTAGDAVGSCAAPGRFDHAVIWHAGALIDLNETILDPSWELISASAINGSGQIAGTGTHQGRDRVYVLTPH